MLECVEALPNTFISPLGYARTTITAVTSAT
jgi:hypothetical protein